MRVEGPLAGGGYIQCGAEFGLMGQGMTSRQVLARLLVLQIVWTAIETGQICFGRGVWDQLNG